MYAITLNGEVVIGLNGERCEGIESKEEARKIARELEYVFAPQLKGETLEIEETDSEE
jgi:pseudouridine-5'-phosphate glycosidase